MPNTRIELLSAKDAAPIFNWLTSYAFRQTPPVADEDQFAERISHTEGFTKFLILYEGDTPASSAAAGAMTQNIRGTLVDMAGIFMVTTHPDHRRKGYSFQLLGDLFRRVHEEGGGFSCLYPFRESFYERLGYANLPGSLKIELNIQSLKPLLKNTYQSTLELTEFIKQPERYYQFVDLYQKQTHGTATFKKNIPPDPDRNKFWVLFSTLKGEPDGMLVYTLEGGAPTQLKFNINRFYALSQDSHYHFLSWIARHIDQASEVSIILPPFAKPRSWSSDLEVKLGTFGLAPMGRVLDIEKMKGLNAGEGAFKVEIIDPTCPWNEGAWTFESHNGKLVVARAKQAKVQMSIQGLSALVYGGILPGSFKYRGWGDIPASLSQVMLKVFPPAIPYLHQFF